MTVTKDKRTSLTWTWNRPDPANTIPFGGFGLIVSAASPAAVLEGAAGATLWPCGGNGICPAAAGSAATLDFAGG